MLIIVPIAEEEKIRLSIGKALWCPGLTNMRSQDMPQARS